MDMTDLRSLYTALSLAVFVGIIWWAFSKRNKASFDEAARLPLQDD